MTTSSDVLGPRLTDYPLAELKLIYRVLHRHLSEEPELLDSELFESLQSHLQSRAAADGVDITHHAAWDAWLGNTVVACELRLAKRAHM